MARLRILSSDVQPLYVHPSLGWGSGGHILPNTGFYRSLLSCLGLQIQQCYLAEPQGSEIEEGNIGK